MTSWSRSRRLARAALAALAVLPAAPAGAQVKPYKIAEAELLLLPFSPAVESPPLAVPKDVPTSLRVVARVVRWRAGLGCAMSVDEVLEALTEAGLPVEGLHLRAELSGPGLRGPLKLPRAVDPPSDDPLVLTVPPLARPGDYTLSGLRLVAGRRRLLPVGPGELTLRVVEDPLDADLADTTPPHPIFDLSATIADAGRVLLTWTPVGDDPVAQYELAYHTFPIEAEDFFHATVSPEPVAAPCGTAQTFEVTGLRGHKTYYFTLRARDDAGNWSDPSNRASVSVR